APSATPPAKQTGAVHRTAPVFTAGEEPARIPVPPLFLKYEAPDTYRHRAMQTFPPAGRQYLHSATGIASGLPAPGLRRCEEPDTSAADKPSERSAKGTHAPGRRGAPVRFRRGQPKNRSALHTTPSLLRHPPEGTDSTTLRNHQGILRE